MIVEPFGQPRGFRTFLAAAVTPAFLVELYRSSSSERTYFGTCEGNEGKRIHHGEQAWGAGPWPSFLRELWSWIALRSRSRSSTVLRSYRVVGTVLFKSFLICMEDGGLHARKDGLEVIPSTAASGPAKTSGPVQAAPALDFGVRYSLPLIITSRRDATECGGFTPRASIPGQATPRLKSRHLSNRIGIANMQPPPDCATAFTCQPRDPSLAHAVTYRRLARNLSAGTNFVKKSAGFSRSGMCTTLHACTRHPRYAAWARYNDEGGAGLEPRRHVASLPACALCCPCQCVSVASAPHQSLTLPLGYKQRNSATFDVATCTQVMNS